MEVSYIYGLHTSFDDSIRYIGKSINPVKRLKLHYSQRNKGRTHKNNWINKCVKEGLKVEFKIIEEVNSLNWREREKYWIGYYKNISSLTNTSPGGEGGCGKKYHMDYDICKEEIKKYNITSKSQWIKISHTLPTHIPKNPVQFFKEKWVSWGDFLSTNRIQDNCVKYKYLDYISVKKWIHKNLKIDTISGWKSVKNQLPEFIPKRPERFYKKRGWVSWGDLLGNNRVAHQHRQIVSYHIAKNKVNELNIKSIIEYKKLQKVSELDLPVHPHLTYKNKGFTSYEEFFRL